MPSRIPFTIATGHHRHAPPHWMPATGVEPLALEDPVLVWLRYHGGKYGFQPDTSRYEFLDFIGAKGQQFEDAWIKKMAPNAIRVCTRAHEVRFVGKVQETFELMQRGVPVLVQPALWWAPEQIYGVPDLLVHTSWLETHLPHLMTGATDLDGAGKPGHYVVFDMKFTSNLNGTQKANSLEGYAAQVRIYSYILGHLQGIMPQRGYLVTRDQLFDPIPVKITSMLNRPLDRDLAAMRDQFVDIKLHGAEYVPWRDAIVASNLGHREERWHTAKQVIARAKTPGGDPSILFQISSAARRDLARYGFGSLASLLRADPRTIPLEKCAGLGQAKSQQIRAILEANRSGVPVLSSFQRPMPRKEFEFYVDFEYFTNINVDFERQWPALDGCEMIFMIGLGWEEQGDWSFQNFVAPAENHVQERKMLEEFLEFLQTRTGGTFTDGARTSLYHWTSAEVWQALRASDRHRFPESHPLRRLPWCDLQRGFLEGPIGLPNLWSYQLKAVSKAVGRLRPDLAPQWPGDLDQGLRAMVMGWQAYQAPQPLESAEMKTIAQYLEADCRAVWGILAWLRLWTGWEAALGTMAT
jgi:hypothetical protein